MASFDYARSRATAERLIAKFGAGGFIRRSITSGPDYDPVITHEEYDCQLVTLEYSDKDVDGTLIRNTDKLIYISTAGLTITLEKSDKIIAAGEEHAIENLKPLSPAGIVVFWEVQGRR